MADYSWPSVYFAYLTFFILAGLAAYFLVRTWRDGYWGEHSEDVKYRMLDEDQ
jgi:hypothetical protein